MTTKQKKILLQLLNGGFISGSVQRIVVFDRRRIPLIRLHEKTFLLIKKYLKKQNGRFVLSIQRIRRQRKNNWLKAEYLRRLKEAKTENQIDNLKIENHVQ